MTIRFRLHAGSEMAGDGVLTGAAVGERGSVSSQRVLWSLRSGSFWLLGCEQVAKFVRGLLLLMWEDVAVCVQQECGTDVAEPLGNC